MRDYTPTTEQVRELFLQDCLSSEYDEAGRQFDRWLQQVKRGAFDEGWIERAKRDPTHRVRTDPNPAPPPRALNPHRT